MLFEHPRDVADLALGEAAGDDHRVGAGAGQRPGERGEPVDVGSIAVGGRRPVGVGADGLVATGAVTGRLVAVRAGGVGTPPLAPTDVVVAPPSGGALAIAARVGRPRRGNVVAAGAHHRYPDDHHAGLGMRT